MNTIGRYVLVVLLTIISLHFLLSFTHEEYGRVTSIENIKSKFPVFGPAPPPEGYIPKTPTDTAKNPSTTASNFIPAKFNTTLAVDHANATLLMLARNTDIDGAVRSIREMEERFNRKFNYPYVFLNEVPFSDEFKRRISVLSDAKMEFGIIPHDHWFQPDWIDEKKATAERDKMKKENVIYGDSVSYRNMCRYNSGFFFKHELLLKYRWYWRIEPDVHFHCDVQDDPFRYMEDHKKTYGFLITMYEYGRTIQTLWPTVKKFIKDHPQYIHPDNSMHYISDDSGDTYNRCHFWSNFEIADMDFWRGEAYQAYFNTLEKAGGFYYERWGDAPVHSLAAALFLPSSAIHFFNGMGYEHNPYIHCPKEIKLWKKGHCSCNQAKSFDYDGYSCMKQWDRIQ